MIKQGASLKSTSVLSAKKGGNFEPPYLWNMTAGLRHLFMFSPLGDKEGHESIQRKYNITAKQPENLLEYWPIFVNLYQNMKIEEQWNTEILLFSNQWIETLYPDISSKAGFNKKIHVKLLDIIKGNMVYGLNNFAWKPIYKEIRESYQPLPNDYLAEAVERLLEVAMGQLPGFAPVIDDTVGPVHLIRACYKDTYQLNEHNPVMMCPSYLTVLPKSKSNCVYYPLALFREPNDNNVSSENNDKIQLKEIESLLSHYVKTIKSTEVNPSIIKLFNQLKFEFYDANDKEAIGSGILPINEMIQNDVRLAKDQSTDVCLDLAEGYIKISF